MSCTTPAAWADRVLSAPDMPTLHDAMCSLAAELGLIMPTYCLAEMPEARPVSEAMLISFPDAWERHYMAHGYFRDDPVIVTALRAREAFIWRETPLPNTPRARRIMAEAADFGVRDGLTAPLWGGPLVGLCSSLPDSGSAKGRAEILTAARPSFMMMTLLVHERACRLYHEQTAPGLLTPRERECVRWLAAGKTGTEIADILHISSLTVTQHLKSAMRKLDASTRAQLAVRAVALGLADPV